MRYEIDSVFWWPRLAAVMPEDFRARVVANLTPVITCLNLATMTLFSGVVVGVGLGFAEGLPCWGVVSVVAALILARACYLTVSTWAGRYGQSLRTAFDLYRFDLLKQMHIPFPLAVGRAQTLAVTW